MNDELNDLILELAEFELDPLGFVYWAFPWGEPGSPLEHEQLEDWQIEFFDTIGKKLREGLSLQAAMDGVIMPVKLSRTTGHGAGKSAALSMFVWWAMSTMVDTKGVITANTEPQLRTKTWPEIAKWHRMFIARDLFEITATAIFPIDEAHRKTWRMDVIPWSEHNTEAFAGLHNIDRRIVIVFDESSGIADGIWEVVEGATTDINTQIIWLATGNPTRATGRLRETAAGGRFAKRWDHKAIDTRTCRRTNKVQIAEWEQDYGEDSDFFRVRVRGAFPKTDADSFIGYDLAKSAVSRELPEVNEHALMMGVDVARFGDDLSVCYFRRGRDARSIPPKAFQKLDTIALAMKVRDLVFEHWPAVVCVDETGIGAGVVDQLLSMQLPTIVIGINFGGGTDGLVEEKCLNKRAEMWFMLREWLSKGCIPEVMPLSEITLVDQLTGPLYTYNDRGFLLLESKKDMKRRKVPSPDHADGLALTFAVQEPPINPFGYHRQRQDFGHDYNPMEAI